MKKKELKQLGIEIKHERELKNIPLEKIVDNTKININFLKSIEEGNFQFLPKTYVRYFLKSYLQQLGGNTEHYLIQYDEILKSYEQPIIADNNSEKHKSDSTIPLPNWLPIKKQYIPIFISIGAVLLLTAAILSVNNKNDDSIQQVVKADSLITEQDSEYASFSSFQVAKRNLYLNLVAHDRTWLQITIDDSAAQEYIFEKGDSVVWQAEKQFLLKVGNSSGIRLYLNGNDLGQLGNTSEVVNLFLTKDGIQQAKL